MALWGISTTTETAANNYAIPKHLSENDRNNTPWNCYADMRGWIYRRYHSSEQSGLSTDYYDEVLVPVTGLNTTGQGGDAGSTGIGTAGPVAVFFEDPNKSSRISIGGGGTAGIATNTTGYIHVVFNELVFASAGATMNIRTFDANGANEGTRVVAYATSAIYGSTQYAWTGLAGNNNGSPDAYTNYNGQITNRVAFAFTSPSVPLSANVLFLTTAVSAGNTAGIGATVIFVNSTSGVSVGSSVTVNTNAGVKVTSAPVISVGSTFVEIGAGSTSNAALGVGSTVTFTTLTRATVLKIDVERGFIGVVTDGANGVGVLSAFTGFGVDLLRNVGGAGTAFSGVGIGTTTLTVS
jgi:hypothetical protein